MLVENLRFFDGLPCPTSIDTDGDRLIGSPAAGNQAAEAKSQERSEEKVEPRLPKMGIPEEFRGHSLNRGVHRARARRCDDFRWEVRAEMASSAEFTVNLEFATVSLQHMFDDREPQTGTTANPCSCQIDPVEAFGDAIDVFRCDTNPLIINAQLGT